MGRSHRTISLPTKKSCIFWYVFVLRGKTEIFISNAVQHFYIKPKTSLQWRLQSFVQVPGQKPEAVEHDRAMETGKMDDRHLAWEERMPDSLEWCVFPFFLLSLFLCHLQEGAGQGSQRKKGSKTKLAWVQALPQQLVQENLLSQVQVEPGWNAE